jgi:AmiR/NasT family two-component response regulator
MTTTANGNGGVSAETWHRFRGQEKVIRELETENQQLQTALNSRIIIEQAKGAICARCGVSPEEAFALMRGLARSQRRDIHGYAAEIVANGGRVAPGLGGSI